MMEYTHVLGSLHYFLLMRPHIVFAIIKLAQCVSSLRPLNWNMMKQVLRYLFGAQILGITLNWDNKYQTNEYYNVNWGCETTNKRSQIGFIGDTLRTWKSSKQPSHQIKHGGRISKNCWHNNKIGLLFSIYKELCK